MTMVVLVGGVSFALAVWAHVRAARENRRRRLGRVVIFDAWRAAGVTASGWVFGCVVALLEPAIVEHLHMPPPVTWPASLELGVAAGVASFVLYAWERRHGRHTWQRYPRERAIPC